LYLGHDRDELLSSIKHGTTNHGFESYVLINGQNFLVMPFQLKESILFKLSRDFVWPWTGKRFVMGSIRGLCTARVCARRGIFDWTIVKPFNAFLIESLTANDIQRKIGYKDCHSRRVVNNFRHLQQSFLSI
jgi:hypothetical protein